MMHNADLPYAPANGYEIVGRITNTPSHVDEYSTIESEVLRRYNCVVTSLQDAPVVVPGNQILYGGGSVIAAAMAERATGQTYEALLQQHVYDKLGMTRSGIGRLATTAVPDGVWLHRAGTSGNPLPEPWMTSKAQTFTSHNPDGGVNMSAPDMGRFIAANLFGGKPNPVLSELTLGAAQDRSAFQETPCARSGWFGDATKLEHNGFNDFMWADLRIYPEQNYGVGVMTNVGGPASSAGASAVFEMIGILEEMHSGFGWFG